MSDGLSGTLTADGHKLTQRVYYEDTDFSGVVYHARYLHFLERGRTDYLRCLGIQQGDAGLGGEEGLTFVVRHMDIDFKASARMDDVVEINTTPHRVSGAKLVLDQTIGRGALPLIQARVTIAVVNAQGRPRRLPSEVGMRFGLGYPP